MERPFSMALARTGRGLSRVTRISFVFANSRGLRQLLVYSRYSSFTQSNIAIPFGKNSCLTSWVSKDG
jgi:hypothetical protein